MPRGDDWRKFMAQYEKGRPWGSCFEVANLGKSSIMLDLKTEEGRNELC